MTPAVLDAFVLFDELDEAERRSLLDEMEILEAKAGEVVFAEGETADGLLLLLRGRLSLATVDGAEQGEFGPGTTFGAHALVAPCAREITAEAAGDVRLLVLSRSGFERVGERHPHAALRLALAMLRENGALVREAAHRLQPAAARGDAPRSCD